MFINICLSGIAFTVFALYYTNAGECIAPVLSSDDYRNIPVLVGAGFGLVVAKIPWLSPRNGLNCTTLLVVCILSLSLSLTLKLLYFSHPREGRLESTSFACTFICLCCIREYVSPVQRLEIYCGSVVDAVHFINHCL